MISITIRPATRADAGWLTVKGHGQKDVCGTVTALVEGLAANLRECWDIHTARRAAEGDYELRWSKTDRAGRGVSRANSAAGFVYVAAKALAAQYPQDVQVTREVPGYRRYGDKEVRT